jgi:hypothetical protein
MTRKDAHDHRGCTSFNSSFKTDCDSDSKKPGWAADQRSVCQQVYPIRPHGS